MASSLLAVGVEIYAAQFALYAKESQLLPRISMAYLPWHVIVLAAASGYQAMVLQDIKCFRVSYQHSGDLYFSQTRGRIYRHQNYLHTCSTVANVMQKKKKRETPARQFT
jgi:hypothetical protein